MVSFSTVDKSLWMVMGLDIYLPSSDAYTVVQVPLTHAIENAKLF